MMSLLLFIFQLLIFDFAYSFLLGIVLFIPALILAGLSPEDKPASRSAVVALAALTAAVCVGQGLIVARAVGLSLAATPDRWSIVWWVVGYAFSIPMAQMRALRDPEQGSGGACFGIAASSIAYVACLIVPSLAVGPLDAMARWLSV